MALIKTRFSFFIPALFLISISIPSFSRETPADSSEKEMVEVSRIILIGNKTTRNNIVMREIIFREGDTLLLEALKAKMERSRENLMNTSLFNFVSITHQADVLNKVQVVVQMAERWYIFPLPIFELVDRNFNEWWLTKDFRRTNYGAYLIHTNFRGRAERMRLNLRLGYSENIGVQYSIPYINKHQKDGLAFTINYARAKEVPYFISESKLLYYKNENDYVRHDFLAAFRYTRRDFIYQTHSFFMEYRNNEVADTVTILNNRYFINEGSHQQNFTLGYNYRFDRRDYKPYALKGHYFELEAAKQGLGLLRNEPNQIYIISILKKYWKLAPRFYFAASLKGKASGKKESPYVFSRGLGYGTDIVRGYEYYVTPGQNFVLAKQNLKFILLPTRISYVNYIPLEKFRTIPHTFYLNLFCDQGYVRDRYFSNVNPLANSILIGYGAGLDYVTYYSIVFRVEYSINRLGEGGVFLHFTAPI